MSNNADITRPDSPVKTVDLPVDEIVPDPNQPRKTCTSNEIDSLRQSITATGQISPIVVKQGSDGKYVIVVGERRWRAIKEAGIPHIKCIVRDDIDDQKALEMQLAENCQREDIAPLDQAWAFKAYLENYGVSQRELSRRTGIPQRTISARLALLSLPLSMHAQIESGDIGPHEALKISELPADQQGAVADAVATGRIGSRILDNLVSQAREHPQKALQLIRELTVAQSSVPSSGAITDIDMLGAVTTTPDSPCIGIGKNERKEEVDLENKPAIVKLLSEMRAFLDIATKIGLERQRCCPNLNEEGLCGMWCWEEDGVRKGVGELVKYNGNWYVRPSPHQCALCTNDLLFQLVYLEGEVENTPASGLKREFKCDCGSSGEIAVAVKCTKCDKETWWGWWPEKS